MGLLTRTLEFPLINRYSRQFFDLTVNEINVRFLYDSGAKIPVWCSGTDKFLKSFPGAEKLDGGCQITGFGKGKESADAYSIPVFALDDGKKKFEIEKLVVALLLKPFIGCDFIISETMFTKTDTFSYRREKRELHLICDDKVYHCSAIRRDQEIKDISVWTQT